MFLRTKDSVLMETVDHCIWELCAVIIVSQYLQRPLVTWTVNEMQLALFLINYLPKNCDFSDILTEFGCWQSLQHNVWWHMQTILFRSFSLFFSVVVVIESFIICKGFSFSINPLRIFKVIVFACLYLFAFNLLK